MEVPAFAIARCKVTNGDYLDFVRQGAPAPFFWTQRDGEWFYRGMWQEIPLPLDWPDLLPRFRQPLGQLLKKLEQVRNCDFSSDPLFPLFEALICESRG